MKKKGGWLLDAFIGLVLSLAVFFSYLISAPFLESLELKAFDMRSKLRQSLDPAAEIVLISIDDDSLAQLGRWPWPRHRIAEMIDKLAGAQPKVIGLNVLFSEPERNDGLLEIDRLKTRYEELVAAKAIVERKAQFGPEFSSSTARLDSDSRLMESLERSGKVVLPMFFTLGGVRGARPEELPISISSSAMTTEMVRFLPEGQMPDATRATYPLVSLAEKAGAIGHVNLYPEFDGVVRREVPVVRYGESYYPSYALQLVLSYLGMKPVEAVFKQGEKVQIGDLTIPLDANNGMLISFNGPAETFRYYPFHDVMNDRVTMEAFKDKIVIIGPTAVGVSTLYVTPVAHNFHSLEVVANVIENILHRKFLNRPEWAANMEMGLLGFIAFFIMFLLPRLRALLGAVLSLLLMTAMMGAGTYLFINGEWVKVTYPCVLLITGYLVIISKRFLVTEKGKELVEADAIETNKMLGLTFQGKGDLDLAFEKFRRCPLDDNMMETLYNLSLDFERKRQYSKAVAVLSHVAAKDPKYKDIETKMPVLKQAGEGAVFGGVGGGKKEGTVMITEGASTKPTLGRYEIEKELGRGAMGVVYLGRDPKINRRVAIKTMSLEDGSDDADAKEIKERFFREAESAGTLNHPNIVRIFDAGEENEVAYIAMELLDGADLTNHTGKDNLLPTLRAMEYVATVAEALSFAHSQGIVHRDIKPANIMLLKDGSLRVADFGIARITSSSKTATGTVMGTPSYMSPEQVQGKKVDGRADIFSLTVTLFEFLTGEKPFKGGEGIGTLLFQIANDPHPNILTVKPDLPPCVAPIIDKGLAKDPEQRYGNGNDMAAALHACIAAVKAGTAGEPATSPPAAPQPAPEAKKPVEAVAPVAIELPRTEAPWGAKPAAIPGVEPPKPVEPEFSAPAKEPVAPPSVGLPTIEPPKPAAFDPEPAPIELPKVEEPAPGLGMLPADAALPGLIELPPVEPPQPVEFVPEPEPPAAGAAIPAPIELPEAEVPESAKPAFGMPRPAPVAFVPEPEPPAADAATPPPIDPVRVELPEIELPKSDELTPISLGPDSEDAIAPIELPNIELPDPVPLREGPAPQVVPGPLPDETVRLEPGSLPPFSNADPDATIKLDPKPRDPL